MALGQLPVVIIIIIINYYYHYYYLCWRKTLTFSFVSVCPSDCLSAITAAAAATTKLMWCILLSQKANM